MMRAFDITNAGKMLPVVIALIGVRTKQLDGRGESSRDIYCAFSRQENTMGFSPTSLWRPSARGWFCVIVIRHKWLMFYHIAHVRLNDFDVPFLETSKNGKLHMAAVGS
jgi:hypothetical protein